MPALLLLAALLGVAAGAGCSNGFRDDEPLSPQDSVATALELRAPVDTQAGRPMCDDDTSRDLPLDVDGLRLARTIATAFERQTSVLDRRDESFEGHTAHIRVGATSSSRRQNFAEVTVEQKGGREQLTVKLSRSAAGAPAR